MDPTSILALIVGLLAVAFAIFVVWLMASLTDPP